MYDCVKSKETVTYANQEIFETLKNAYTPILRNPYASQVKPNQKQHPVQAVGKPIHA